MADTLSMLKQQVFLDLEAQFSGEPGYNENVLQSKINIAFKEVMQARTARYGGKYPSCYTEERSAEDLSQYYSHIANLALFDYNTIGIEFQTSSTENSTTRTYRDRDRLFNGIVPLTRIV